MSDSKQRKDRLFRNLVSYIMYKDQDPEEAQSYQDLPTVRDVLSTLASWAGKGKDELIQVLCREVGTAIAAMLKEPLQQVVDAQKLVVTIEFSKKNSASTAFLQTKVRKKRPKRKQA